MIHWLLILALTNMLILALIALSVMLWTLWAFARAIVALVKGQIR